MGLKVGKLVIGKSGVIFSKYPHLDFPSPLVFSTTENSPTISKDVIKSLGVKSRMQDSPVLIAIQIESPRSLEPLPKVYNDVLESNIRE